MRVALVAAAVVVLAATLQGCGGGGDATTTTHEPEKPTTTPHHGDTTVTVTTVTHHGPPTTTTLTTVTKTSQHKWTLDPIIVKDGHLWNSKTNERFVSKGIGFPNAGEKVDEWIKVLERVHGLSKDINVIRIYEPPTCALNSTCFEPFMRKADELGIYVVVPGTGTVWGWLPGEPAACKLDKVSGAQGCYEAGGVLGWGQKIVQHFHYPNTLAIVIGNEFEMQMLPFIPTLKAYARDLKKYMKMCASDENSPTKNKMRQIPLMYACSDADGDRGVEPKADYMFCGASDSDDASIDIFGLNVERWCSDDAGKTNYAAIQTWVDNKKYEGSFLYSEMGCATNNLPPEMNGSRSWNQVPSFFKNYPVIDGFMAYVYWSPNPNFNMFDGPTSTAKEFDDGKNFFEKMKSIGTYDSPQPGKGKEPQCSSQILGTKIEDYSKVKVYDTGDSGLPGNCPKPYAVEEERSEVVV